MKSTTVAASCLLTLASACSHVDFYWQRPQAAAAGPEAIKRLAVWAHADEATAPGLAATLGQITTEYAKLRRNYLVLQTLDAPTTLKAACSERVEGVLWVQALQAKAVGDNTELTLRAELWSCRGPSLTWSIQGHRASPQADPNLRQLIESYQASVGAAAAAWAAPSFVLLQELLNKLPDPQLSDHDIEEKLELGWNAAEAMPPSTQDG